MSAPDVVPVAWIGDVQRAYLQSGADRFGVVSNVRNHGDALYSQATVDALQARIDELEAQLFIEKADAALPLYEAMGFGPLPAFPSIRTNQIESKV